MDGHHECCTACVREVSLLPFETKRKGGACQLLLGSTEGDRCLRVVVRAMVRDPVGHESSKGKRAKKGTEGMPIATMVRERR